VGKTRTASDTKGPLLCRAKKRVETAELKAGYSYNNDYFYSLSQHNAERLRTITPPKTLISFVATQRTCANRIFIIKPVFELLYLLL
jgi:hypothetical protein